MTATIDVAAVGSALCRGPISVTASRRPIAPTAMLVGTLTLLGVTVESGRLWPDSYLNLYAGRDIWQHGIPHHETLTSVDAGRAIQDQQWLAHLVFYGSWRLGGYPLVVLLSAALVASSLALLAGTLVRHGTPARTAALWTVVAAAACLNNTVPRAQSFAYPLFVATIAIVFADAKESLWRRRLLLLLPMLCLWANLHGSVLLGAAIIGCYSGYRAVLAFARHDHRSVCGYAVLAGGAVTSLVVTPYGLAGFRYYTSVLGNSSLTHYISEWKPPSWSDGVSLVYFLTAVLVGLVVGATWIVRRRPPPLVSALVVLALFVLSARAIRNEIWFVLAATMWAAALSTPSRQVISNDRRRGFQVGAVIASGLLMGTAFIVALCQPVSTFETGVSPRLMTVADLASKSAGGPVLADELQSPALLWLRPDAAGRVAYDIRFEQYSSVELGAYIHFLDGDRGALSFASRYRVVLLSRNDHSKLLGLLEHSPEWQIGSESKQAILFTRPAAA